MWFEGDLGFHLPLAGRGAAGYSLDPGLVPNVLFQFGTTRSVWEYHVVRLRFQRTGRHNHPCYRLAAIDSRTRRDGPVIENLGWYNPIDPDATKQVNFNEDRIKYWLSVGALPSETVEDILAKRGIGNLKAWEERRKSRSAVVAKNKVTAAAAAAEAAANPPKKDVKK